MVNRRVALVTGAGRGIGRRTAEVLAAQGYAVALNDLAEPTEALQAVRASGAEAVAAIGDVASAAAIPDIAAAAKDAFGDIDVLVNNAGISVIAAAEDIS